MADYGYAGAVKNSTGRKDIFFVIPIIHKNSRDCKGIQKIAEKNELFSGICAAVKKASHIPGSRDRDFGKTGKVPR